MKLRLVLLLAATLLPPAYASTPNDPAHAGPRLFREKVRGVLEASCLKCHGGEKTRGGLDLSTREGLLKGGDEGPSITPGNARTSSLVRKIRHLEDPFMPPKSDPLPEAAVRDIETWIDLGAPYDAPLGTASPQPVSKELQVTESDRQFWSFAPLKDPAPPTVKNESWPKTSIDRFILAKLDEKGLSPAPPASRAKLIRRVYYDLIGLPPTPEQVEAFLSDVRPGAYERLVDQLLASPHHGERWARHWLDVARYADSTGYESDNDRPSAYHYRDFVIRALNQDMPFDRFLRLQLAGDIIEPADPHAAVATGFLTAGPTETQKETEQSRYDEFDDIVATTASAMLGLTVGCARCHDHKYDPIPTRDYYSMLAAFTTSRRHDLPLDGEKPRKDKSNTALVMRESKPGPARTPLLLRGNPETKGTVLDQSFLAVLTHPAIHAPSHYSLDHPRLALAQWVTDLDHGAGRLAARVIVNRLWKHHFGRGIVATPNDFGLQGDRPTHPELLDHLASELVRHNWSLKHIHRLILTSAVYQQGSVGSAEADPTPAPQPDADNRLFWRRTPQRLEAEIIRDAMLHVAGNLNTTMFGPAVKIPLPPEVIETGSVARWPKKIEDGPLTWRRSVYLFQKRSVRIPMFESFDAPDMMSSVGHRIPTTVPPQALALMNSAPARDQARRFADRVTKEAGDTRARVHRAFYLALSRPPSADELARSLAFIERQTSGYQSSVSGGAAGHPAGLALLDFCQVLLNLNEFIYIE